MKEDKKSFVVYCDIEENLDRMTDEEVGLLFRSMVHYSNTGEEPELDRLMTFIFTPIRQQMDRDREKWNGIKESRSRAGKKGGEKSAKARAERVKTLQEGQNDVIQSKQRLENPSKRSKIQANQAVNVNVNDNVNVNVNDNVIQLAAALLARFNSAAGTAYSPDDREFAIRIQELVNEGHSEEELEFVMKHQIDEWKDEPSMQGYLQPGVVFGDNFGTFLRLANKEEQTEGQAEEQEENKVDERHNIHTDN